MKKAIEQELTVLTGLSLSSLQRMGTWRVQHFHFGKLRSVQDSTRAKFIVGKAVIAASCAWQILGNRHTIVRAGVAEQQTECAKGDVYAAFQTRLEAGMLLVESVVADSAGGVIIYLADGYRLELIPLVESNEHWSWALPQGGREMIVTAHGIEEVD